MRLVDDDIVFAGNRCPVYGAGSSVQRRDRCGHTVFAGQPTFAGVAGADAVVRLEHRCPGGSDRKCRVQNAKFIAYRLHVWKSSVLLCHNSKNNYRGKGL